MIRSNDASFGASSNSRSSNRFFLAFNSITARSMSTFGAPFSFSSLIKSPYSLTAERSGAKIFNILQLLKLKWIGKNEKISNNKIIYKYYKIEMNKTEAKKKI